MNLSAVTIGQYFPGSSFLHRMDPRTKILAVVLLSITIFLPKEWPGYVVNALVVLAAVAVSRVPLRPILRGLRPLVVFLAITLVFDALMTPGQAVFTVWKLTVTKEGLILSLTASIRLVMLVVVASLLTLTTSPIRLTDGLERLLRPFQVVGVPAHELALMMTIALRFIPTLADEADRIMKAQTARGADFRSGNMMARVASMIPVMVPLFVASFRRADELATAMEARGYRGGEKRTRMKELAFTGVDAAAAVALVVYTAGITYLRFSGRG